MQLRSGALALLAFAAGCGPIEAPPGAMDLGRDPAAFRARFDAEVGVPRLVLLLSPG
jgi:hypothetical protein